jgi:hypothetical protein
MNNKTRRHIFASFRSGSHWLQGKFEDFRALKGQAEFVNSVLFKSWNTRSTVLKCSNHENIRARYVGLFITGQNVSLKEFSRESRL